MNTRIEKHERFTHDGTEILRCRICLEYPTERKEIGDFYRRCAENTYAFVKAALLPIAEKAYIEDTDERKRFHFAPFKYQLLGEVTLDGEYFSQRLDAVFSRRGEVIESFTDGQVWECESELLVPPDIALRIAGATRKKNSSGAKSVLLFDNGAYVLRGGKWERLKF